MSFHLTEAFEDQVIRISGTPDAPLFNATDVCGVLGLANSRDALSGLDEDEKGVALTDTLGGTQTMSYVTESGLYHLAFKSRKAAAKRFRRWVTSEVLPAIRKNGAFHADDLREKRNTLKMPLTQWIGTLGLDLRDDAKTATGILSYVSRAATLLRWYASAAKSRDAESLFQEVPLPVLDLAEGLWMADTKSYRMAALPAPADVIRREERYPGGTIRDIMAAKKARDAEMAAQEEGVQP